MSLHQLSHVTIGVPNLRETAEYYADFGLAPLGEQRFATVDGGEQLQLVQTPRRRLVDLTVNVDDEDDLARVERNLAGCGFSSERRPTGLAAVEPTTGLTAYLRIAPRLRQPESVAVTSNGPGRNVRLQTRAPGVTREGGVHPRKLGHVVLGSTDIDTIRRFFIDGLGFKISDEMEGRAAFLRCSTDHHNVMVQSAPVAFLHHTSWQVEDVDEIGRGASALLDKDPSRHVWGLGRHFVGSNYFWYLRDPAGNYSEYYADLDVILEDQLWKPEVWEGRISYYSWGPAPSPSFVRPDDLTELMAGLHSAR